MARSRKQTSKTAVAYLRVSTDRQELGPEAQRAAIEAWAARTGTVVVAWHEDLGVGGATPIEQRPGLVAALASVREHRAAMLVVAKRDRIARDVGLAALVERAVASVGAALRSADGASDATGVEGIMLRGMADIFAAVEKEMIRQRTTAALQAKRAKGEFCGKAPFGYRVAADGVRLEKDEREQDVIALVGQLSASGMTQTKIASELTARGMLSRAGTPFGQVQVFRILKSLQTAA